MKIGAERGGREIKRNGTHCLEGGQGTKRSEEEKEEKRTEKDKKKQEEKKKQNID